MAKYAEVREKQRHVDAVAERALDAKLARGVWAGFTFKAKKEEDRLLREKEQREKQKVQEAEEESLYTLF